MADAPEVPAKYLCPICREVLKKPTLTRECNHRFCECCLHQTQPSEDGSFLCPLCRLPFQMSACFHDKDFEKELTRMQFTCCGCKHKLPLLMFNGHQTTCKKLLRATPEFTPVVPTSQQPQVASNRSTFKCPLCQQGYFDCSGLLEHVNHHHGNSSASVVCPVCASMPWGNTAQKSGNFVAHLNLRHKFEYDTFVDYDQDEAAILQATLQASMADT